MSSLIAFHRSGARGGAEVRRRKDVRRSLEVVAGETHAMVAEGRALPPLPHSILALGIGVGKGQEVVL